MTPKLTPELHQALAEQPGRALEFDVFQRFQWAMDYDASEPNPRDFYAAFAETVKSDLDTPKF